MMVNGACRVSVNLLSICKYAPYYSAMFYSGISMIVQVWFVCDTMYTILWVFAR